MSEAFAGGCVIVFFLALWSFAMFNVGSDFGQYSARSVEREKFIIFCTGKAMSYEDCDHIFKGDKPTNG